jgi:hypothetical protein
LAASARNAGTKSSELTAIPQIING